MIAVRATLALFACLCAVPALADPAADFYKGSTVTMVVSTSAGGGYDTLARAIARQFGKHIPGHPTIVVRNMPGAGGIIADQLPLRGRATRRLGAGPDPERPAARAAVRHQTGAVRPAQVQLARHAERGNRDGAGLAHGAGEFGRRFAPARNRNGRVRRQLDTGILRAAAQRDARHQDESHSRLTRGRTTRSSPWSAASSTAIRACSTARCRRRGRLGWRRRKPKRIVQYGPEKLAALGDVPFAPDLVADPRTSSSWKPPSRRWRSGRPLLMPPAVPADRVAAMRKRADGDFCRSGLSGGREENRLASQFTAQRRTASARDRTRLPGAAADRSSGCES